MQSHLKIDYNAELIIKFYLKFKGGKGVASIAGILTAVDLRITLVCLIVFPLIVALTRYVSLASIAVMFCFASMSVLFVYLNYFNLAGIGRIEFAVLVCVMAIFSIYIKVIYKDYFPVLKIRSISKNNLRGVIYE